MHVITHLEPDSSKSFIKNKTQEITIENDLKFEDNHSTHSHGGPEIE